MPHQKQSGKGKTSLSDKSIEILTAAFSVMLELDIDGAQIKNGEGFDKEDSKEIRDSFTGEIDYEFVLEHAHRLWKYRKTQLAEDVNTKALESAVKEAIQVNESLNKEKEAGKTPGFSGYDVCIPGFFEVNKDGIGEYYYNKESKTSEYPKFTHTPCAITAIGRDIDTGELRYKLIIKDSLYHERKVWKKTSDLLTNKGVLGLHEDGVHFPEEKKEVMIKYFDCFIKTFKNDLPIDKLSSKCGWKDNFELFVIGNSAITKEGIFEILQVNRSASLFFSQSGNVQLFAAKANILLKYPSVRFRSYVSCAPVLLRPLYISSFIVDQVAKSRSGKTVSSGFVASFFGNPKKLLLDPTSTPLGISKMAALSDDLPMFIEETTKLSAASKKFVYTLANGNTRVKSGQDDELNIADNFSTIPTCTGESPLLASDARAGEDNRVISINEAITEDIPDDILTDIEAACISNHGHIGILFVKEVIDSRENIKEIYKSYLRLLPKVEDRTSASIKKFFACIATAGYILEKVFSKLGIEPADPLKICNRYFEKNVLENVKEPDHIKILRFAYSFFTTNENRFISYAEDEETNERKRLGVVFGYVRNTNGNVTINFEPEPLKRGVIKSYGDASGASRLEAATEQWKIEKISNTKTRIRDGKQCTYKTTEIFDNRKTKTVYQIPLDNFYKFLDIEPPIEGSETTIPSNQVKPKTSGQTFTQNTGFVVNGVGNPELEEILMQEEL